MRSQRNELFPAEITLGCETCPARTVLRGTMKRSGRLGLKNTVTPPYSVEITLAGEQGIGPVSLSNGGSECPNKTEQGAPGYGCEESVHAYIDAFLEKEEVHVVRMGQPDASTVV